MSDDLKKRLQDYASGAYDMTPICSTLLDAKVCIEQLERERAKALVFSNADATPKNVTIYTIRESIEDIMIWYGSHHEGDRYTVSFDGRNMPMDNWGWPT
jgi:hypothetical protein